MIDRKQLLDDLKPLLRELETDLRARCDEVPEIDRSLRAEYEQARSAGRTGAAYEQWRADLVTQVGVAWILSCVFVRFLEDNALTVAPKISGRLKNHPPGAGLDRARDERDLYFRDHPTDSDRDYLLHVFAELAALPATAELFGPHNPLNEHPDWLSGDAAQKLIEFFQKIDSDNTGDIVHDFTDESWDTRFLGDLYQDLSEAARKKYALLQTPVFVEEFILERTLEPAINEFGLKGFKMIDPACGSGHFLLGAFARILNHWRHTEPGAGERELINRVLASIHGVDINPYAVAIARFRLLLAAMRECGITSLKDAPNFQFKLACGDSLLHGSTNEQQVLGFHGLAHHYECEDINALRSILTPGRYQAVVANPPYITVKDRALNQAYRDRYYNVCHRQYPLATPFMQRMFDLAIVGGFTGQITSNSFMKREFGKKLIENYLPKIDLTHVVDTSGAYIPGHGTPTVILFGRHRAPVADKIRAVMGIKGEPSTPKDPAQAHVWSSILSQIDCPGTESEYVSVYETPREYFHKHPWSIGGGGASELKTLLDDSCHERLGDIVTSIGFFQDTHADEAFVQPEGFALRRRLRGCFRPQVRGDNVRDWGFVRSESILFPYDHNLRQWPAIPCCDDWSWFHALRAVLQARSTFGGGTYEEAGRPWFDYHQFPKDRLWRSLAIVFPSVATHNHFTVNDTDCVFNRSAPVIRLKPEINKDEHIDLVGVLNSSIACFWMKQVFHNKGSTVDGQGARQRTMPFEDFYDFDGTKMKQFPLPSLRPRALAHDLDQLSHEILKSVPYAVIEECSDVSTTLSQAAVAYRSTLGKMISLQEELDWRCYQLYGLATDSPQYNCPPPIKLGQRAFEIALARKMTDGEEETTWFVRHNSTPITEIPTDWPEDYRQVVQRRIELIESDRNIGLIERPEYKRRWNIEPWEQQQEKALRNCLLDRLESYFDLDGRMNDEDKITADASLRQPRLTSIAKVADIARADSGFMEVAELYRERTDFDIGALVAELIEAEGVPHLPVLRYKPSGLDKRVAWEWMWELQRLEDNIDALFEIEHLKGMNSKQDERALRQAVWVLGIEDDKKPAVLAELVSAASNLADIVNRKLDLASEDVIKPITDADKRAKRKALGEIPVPRKYNSKDFLSANFWRLRGKLDVPKERWMSFPHCEGEDGSLVIAWAGYDHLQLAQAVAERFENAREHEGRTLVPLLASLGQLIPWLKQWHNEMNPTFGTRLGDFYESHLETEAKALNMTVAEIMAWKPPAGAKKTRKRRKKTNKKD